MEEKKISVTKCAELFMDIGNKQNFGTKMHKYIETYLKTKTHPVVNSEDEKKIYMHFLEFLKDHPFYEFVESEKEISYVYKKRKIVGKIDAIFRNKNDPDEYIVIDWKIMKDLDFERNKKYWYSINLYTKIFRKNINRDGLKIRMYLVLLHQDRASYIIKPYNESGFSLLELLEIAGIK